MTNNFNPKKSGAAERPQLSPEEYVAKIKAEKDAVYQMIDDAATEIVNAPEKFRGYLDTQARMDRYSAANALLIYKQQPQATQLKDFRDWQEDGVKVNKGAKSLSILTSLMNAMNDPFHIELCEDSVKAVLVLLLCYGMGVGIYFSTRRNYRRRE